MVKHTVVKDWRHLVAQSMRLNPEVVEAAYLAMNEYSCLNYLKYFSQGLAADLSPSQWSRLAYLQAWFEAGVQEVDDIDKFYLQDLAKPEPVQTSDKMHFVKDIFNQADLMHQLRMFYYQHGLLRLHAGPKPSEQAAAVLLQWQKEDKPRLTKINALLYLKAWQFCKQGQLQLQFELELQELEQVKKLILSHFPLLVEADLDLALTHYIKPRLTRECLALTYDKTVELLLPLVELQLRHLLMQVPKVSGPFLMIYPHGKSGIMMLVVDEHTQLLDHFMLYPYAPDFNSEDALVHLSKLLCKYPIAHIVWMLQTETKKFVLQLLQQVQVRYSFLQWQMHVISNRFNHWFMPKNQKHPSLEHILQACHFVHHPWVFLSKQEAQMVLNPLFAHISKSDIAELWSSLLQEFMMLTGLSPDRLEPELVSYLPGLDGDAFLKARQEQSLGNAQALQAALSLDEKSLAMLAAFFHYDSRETKKLKMVDKILAHTPVFYHADMGHFKPGQYFYAVVQRIMDYGLFVDVGDKREGLIHISAMGDCYIKDLNEVFQAGDVLIVECVQYDEQQKRLSLRLLADWPAQEQNVLPKPAPVLKKPVVKTKIQAKPTVKKPAIGPSAMELAFAKLKQT